MFIDDRLDDKLPKMLGALKFGDAGGQKEEAFPAQSMPPCAVHVAEVDHHIVVASALKKVLSPRTIRAIGRAGWLPAVIEMRLQDWRRSGFPQESCCLGCEA